MQTQLRPKPVALQELCNIFHFQNTLKSTNHQAARHLNGGILLLSRTKTKEISLQLRKRGKTPQPFISKHFYSVENSCALHQCQVNRDKLCKKQTWVWSKRARFQELWGGQSAEMSARKPPFWRRLFQGTQAVRALRRVGPRGDRPRRSPSLKEQHRRARLRFEPEHLKGNVSFI